MDQVAVTVCIPVYNGEQYIKNTLDSVLAQSYRNIEIIVIDNCSTDHTCEIVASYDDGRITLIQNKENLGMVGNFNECLRHTDHPYLQILCADDYLEPECIAKKVAALENNPTCAIASSAASIANSEGKTVFVRHGFKGDRVIPGREMLEKSFCSHNLFGEPTNNLIRTSCIEKAGRFSEKLYYAVDWEYWMRLCTAGDVCYLDEPLARFYLRKTSESSKLLKQSGKILDDDKVFVELCMNNPAFSFTRAQARRHAMSMKWRLFKRTVFSVLFN